MNENLQAFLNALQENEDLKEKFMEISKKEEGEQKDCTQDYIALAKECGIELTKEDFGKSGEALSDEELANVAGGSKFKDAMRSIAEALAKSASHKVYDSLK